MKKKILKIAGVLLLLVIGFLVALPFFLEAKIGDIIKNNVNNNINGTFDFAEANLSLFSSFPNAEVSIRDMYLLNKAPFEGDTLFSAKKVALEMSIGELFKSSNQPIAIKSLVIDSADLNIKIDGAENANYDIGKDGESNKGETQQNDGFTFAMERYEIIDSKVVYDDLATGIHLEVLDINHKGNGDLSLDNSELETTTNALVSYEMDSTKYLNKNKIKWNAVIGIDLEENKYSFLKNEILINQLPLVFEGFVKINEENQEIAVSFKTPSSNFKNFLAVIPEKYSKNIEDVKTTGNFTIEGQFQGIVDEEHIPKFNININSDNASFKYPDLPKMVRNIYIDVDIKNTTGISEDTYVEVQKASFTIDDDTFNMTSKITELLGNTKVKAKVGGKMNLANISKAYPVSGGLDLKGILNVDVSTTFDMASVENKRYENTQTTGQLAIKNFEYNSDEMVNPVQIKSIAMNFNPKTVTLKEMIGVTGKTDFNTNGTISNLLGFMFNDEKVKGNFNLNSNTFVLNDFMVEETDEDIEEDTKGSEQTVAPSTEERIQIPSFLDVTINASANTVVYDNLILKDVKGNLRINDEKVILSNMTSSMLDGKLAFNGEVSTKSKKPVFTMQLEMDNFKIGETFRAIELFRVLAPVANALEGKLNSNIQISGNLEDDFTLDLKTITGTVLAEVLATDINPEKAKLLSILGSQLNFIKPDKLNLKGLKTALSFEDGTVKVKPFTINYEDIAIKIDGGHTFDKKLNYKASLQVPAKYLGKEVNSLIARIDERELENSTIPVTVSMGGGYTNPNVSTDLTSGIKNLTVRLVAIQKQKLINQGKDKAKNLIGDILSGNSSDKDSLDQKDSTNVGIKDMLGGILGNDSKKQDTMKLDSAKTAKDPVKEAAKDILGGLLGRKKKGSAKSKKDSIN